MQWGRVKVNVPEILRARLFCEASVRIMFILSVVKHRRTCVKHSYGQGVKRRAH